mgnify:CR=1 FL=1
MTVCSPGTRLPSPPTILAIDGLRVAYPGARSPVVAVAGFDLALAPGTAVALVGESGSGKSTVAMSVLGLLPGDARVSGRIAVEGTDVLQADPETLRRMRGRRVGYVGQQSFSAFDPLFPVKSQLREAFRAHETTATAGMEARIALALREAGLELPGAAAGLPPSRLSGGMLQRAQLAAALLHRPPLLVADEPTSALDPVLARRLAGILQAWKGDGTAILLATHDLSLAATVADEVVVMRRGKMVETGPVAGVFARPRDPYTAALVAAHPSRGLRVTPEDPREEAAG